MEEEKRDSLKPFIILLLIVITIWSISGFLAYTYLEEWGIRGQFGDMFGAINSLFSGLALAGIIFTIFLQKKELGLQRQELRDTRKEFIQQNITLKKQRFENTFFQMLSLHNEIVDNLSYRERNNLFEKRGFIEEVYKKLHGVLINNSIKIYKTSIEELEIENQEQLLKTSYDQVVFARFQSFLGHYFRNLYHIYRYIHISDLIEDNEKQFYSAVVRAQLSSFELLLIFYNSFVGLGFPRFRYLITEYNILTNINWDSIIHDSHRKIFDNMEVEEDPIH